MHPDVYKRPLLLILIALLAGLFFFYEPAPGPQDVSHLVGQEVTLTGRVERFYTSKPQSNNVIVKVFSADGKPTSGQVYARLSGFEPLWKDTLQIKGRLQAPYGIDLLGNFNWRTYLAHKHVFSEIKSEHVQVIKSAAWPWRVLRSVRGDILRVFAESFEPPLAQIAGGVLLGERGDLTPEQVSAFQDSGAIHLLVASGGNVGFVTLMSLAVCVLFGVGHKKALWVALLVAGVYTLIAGADAPLMRAYFMTVCGCVGYYLGRNSGVWQGLVLSCIVILICQPASLFETGFEMSFLATAGLIIGLANYPLPTRWPRWARFFGQIFVVTLSVQLVLLPVFTNVFYKVSLTGLVANMVLVPLASVLLVLSFAYYVFSVLHIGIVLYYPTVFCLKIFYWLVQFFASFRLSAVTVTAWGAGTIIAYYVVLFWAFHATHKKLVKKWLVPVLVIACVALGMQYGYNRTTRVYLLDEWYKNVALVKTTDGIFIVGAQLNPAKVQQALRRLGYSRADMIFMTDQFPAKGNHSVLAPEHVLPFEQAWPEERAWTKGHTAVRMIWGLHATQEGRIWYNTGYTGTKQDEVSYCFKVKNKPEFCVGKGLVLRGDGSVISARLNQTVEVKL